MFEGITVSDRTVQRILNERNYSQTEGRQAVENERINRFLARLYLLPSQFCRVRQCRRVSRCAGQQVPTDRLHSRVRAQRLIGLQGHAYTVLPRCLESLPLPSFHHVMKVKDAIFLNPKPGVMDLVNSLLEQNWHLAHARDDIPIALEFLYAIWADQDDQVMQVVRFGKIVTPSSLHGPATPAAPKADDGFADDLPDWLRKMDLSARAWEEGGMSPSA